MITSRNEWDGWNVCIRHFMIGSIQMSRNICRYYCSNRAIHSIVTIHPIRLASVCVYVERTKRRLAWFSTSHSFTSCFRIVYWSTLKIENKLLMFVSYHAVYTFVIGFLMWVVCCYLRNSLHSKCQNLLSVWAVHQPFYVIQQFVKNENRKAQWHSRKITLLRQVCLDGVRWNI